MSAHHSVAPKNTEGILESDPFNYFKTKKSKKKKIFNLSFQVLDETTSHAQLLLLFFFFFNVPAKTNSASTQSTDSTEQKKKKILTHINGDKQS